MKHVVALLWLALLAGELGSSLAWLSRSSCPSTQQSLVAGRARFTVFSHFGYESGQTYSTRADCSWRVESPASGSWWRITFERIELETSSSVQRCKYDNLTVEYQLNGQWQTRVLCGRHTNLVLVTGGGFRLGFQSDSSVNMRGFKVYWEAISQSQAAQLVARNVISPVFRLAGSRGSCSTIEHRGSPILYAGRWYNTTMLYMSRNDGSYVHNADCSWFLRGRNPGESIYIIFGQVLLEGSYRSPCTLDNITVSYQLPRDPTSRRRVFCMLNKTVNLVSEGSASLQLRTDSSIGNGLNVTWFAAPTSLATSGQFETSREFYEAQCPEKSITRTDGLIRLYYYPPQSYPPGISCSWTVPVPRGKMAEFRFYRFELASGRYRGGYPFGYYNISRHSRYCSSRDDSVTITFKRFSPYAASESETFCANSGVATNRKVVTSVGTAQVMFRSHRSRRTRYRDARGFVLAFRFVDRPEGGSSCPQPRPIDSYRSQIAVQPNDSTNLYDINQCSWNLQPRDSQHVLSLTVNLAGSSGPARERLLPFYLSLSHNRHEPWRYSHSRYPGFVPYCQPHVIVQSNSRRGVEALMPAGEGGQTADTSLWSRETYCPPSVDRQAGIFTGPVNVTITSQGPLNLIGFKLSILNIPKPTPGCSKVNISTVYTSSRAMKVFTIDAQPGCVVAEFLKQKGFSEAYANTMLKVTFELSCRKPGSQQSLDIISQLFVTSVSCNGSTFVYDSWKYPIVLKFPQGTGARLVSKVIYNFPLVQSFCQNLDSSYNVRNNGTFGNIQLPLFVDSQILPPAKRHFSQVACSFELAYRPGYSIRLRISHNLGFEDIDFFCHAKLSMRDVSPHIVLTTKQLDPDSPGAWIEQQVELCHGYSVGSLGTKSELLVDGSVSISLLAMQSSASAPGSGLSPELQLVRDILNQTRVMSLNFIISYEYVPSCPELNCRSLTASRSSCEEDIPVSSMQLEAQLARTPETRSASECKWNIPNSASMREAMARQSDSWLVRLELSNFAFACPCHDCDEQVQHMTVARKPAGDSEPTDRMVVCGDYRSNSRVMYLALTPSLPDIQVAYSALESAINISVTFIDCRLNTSLSQCSTARNLVWGVQGVKQFLLGGSSPAGLIFLAVVLSLLLIGCLLYINREAVGNRVHAALQARQSHNEDTLQLTPESAQTE